MMTEEEYQNDIQEGGESPLAKQKTMKTAVKTAVGRNPTARNSPKPTSAAIMTAEDMVATKNTTVPDRHTGTTSQADELFVCNGHKKNPTVCRNQKEIL